MIRKQRIAMPEVQPAMEEPRDDNPWMKLGERFATEKPVNALRSSVKIVWWTTRSAFLIFFIWRAGGPQVIYLLFADARLM